MRIGTTPVHTFTLPEDVSSYEKIKVIYSQDGLNVLTLTDDKATSKSDKTISFKLTEADTYRFAPEKMVEIQVRAKINGNVVSSDIMSATALRCLDDEVI